MKTQGQATPSKSAPAATEAAQTFWQPSVIWPLVTGLAVGLFVGREVGTPGASAPVAAAIEAPSPTPSPSAAPAAPAAARAPSGDVAAAKFTLAAHSPRKGPKAAKVTLVEISDFECPFCSRAAATVAELQKKYEKDVAFVFVNQPLAFHKNAVPAARAALAANRQGKFWPYHDKLFANQQALGEPELAKYAAEVGLDLKKWRKDYADPAIAAAVDADKKMSDAVGASGTPTFLINGRKLVGAKPADAFSAIIDEELKKADALIAKGTAKEAVSQKLTEEALAAAPAPGAPPARVEVPIGAAPVKGPANAPITIVEFSDFECPFCNKIPPVLKQLEADYKGKVRIAFKHLPLPFHKNAPLAAEASLAAHEQGKFWPFHDKLFENQQSLDRASLEKFAAELGLDARKFKAALDSGKFRAQVQKDAQQAASVGATGTPTFFINGTRFVGAQPLEAFKRVIDEELKRAS